MVRNKNVERLLQLLEKKQITLKQLEQMLTVKEAVNLKVNLPKTKNIYKFGIVSDTHLCDRQCALAELHAFYKLCAAERITEVVHAGDLESGINVYKGQINDLVCHGIDEHMDFIVKNYPKEQGITTYFIGGNHSEAYTKLAGVDSGKLIASRRKDMVYLGLYNATIQLNGIRIMLAHGAGGNSYAISYKIQRMIAALPAGEKPNIYVLGHYHSAMFLEYRNVMAFMAGAFQKGTAFTTRLGLHVQLGGWIVEVEIADDKRHSIKRITPSFIAFY